MQGGSRDPATPWFDAAQDRVPDSPHGRLGDDHPIRRTLRSMAYPASREEIVSAMRDHDDVTPDQAEWLASSLRDDTFASERDVLHALGRWGAPAPGADRSL